MKATALLIAAAFLVAAAIILLPILLAPNSPPPTPAAARPVSPSPARARGLTPGAGRATPTTSSSSTAAQAAPAPTEVLPAGEVPVETAPAVPTDVVIADVPIVTPVPASGVKVTPASTAEATPVPTATSEATTQAGSKPASSTTGPGRIYTGVAMGGVPWNMDLLTNWEKTVAGKTTAIVHFWVFWKNNGAYQPLVPALLDNIRGHGSIPMITWAPEESGAGTNQSDFALSAVISGKHDAYINQFAADARAWGKPFFLRWAHEPDGDWFPWGEDANGNQRGEYAQAWRHVHDLFTQAGATNVTWVWCPNVEFPNSPRSSYDSLYPGDRYVDWTCVDGYNWGSDFPQNGGWSTFHQIFRYSYDEMVQVAPDKPMMLGEWASSEHGGSKPAWIRDAFGVQIPKGFPDIRAVVWYNQTAGPVDWRIESSAASSAAYRAVMASPAYVGAQYGNLTSSPIPPP